MILFFSDHCPHSKMLIETIKRHNKMDTVKCVSVDTLRALQKPIPPSIHSVPALMLMPDKELLFGKAVFDFLLLPGRGKLVSPPTQAPNQMPGGGNVGGNGGTLAPQGDGSPSAFGFSGGLSDAFASYDGDMTVDGESGLNDRAYTWSTISEMNATGSAQPALGSMTETRARKSLPNLDELRSLRDADEFKIQNPNAPGA